MEYQQQKDQAVQSVVVSSANALWISILYHPTLRHALITSPQNEDSSCILRKGVPLRTALENNYSFEQLSETKNRIKPKPVN